MAWYDVIGSIGVAIVLIAYFLLQNGRMDGQGFAFCTVNLLGSLLITISLLYTFNLSSFIIELAWSAISIYGMVRAWRRRHTRAPA